MAIHIVIVPSLLRQVSLFFLTYSYNPGQLGVPHPTPLKAEFKVWHDQDQKPSGVHWAIWEMDRTSGQPLVPTQSWQQSAGRTGWREVVNDRASMGLTSAMCPLPTRPTLTSSQCGGVVPCCLRSKSRSQRGRGSVEACELLQWRGAK